MTANRIVQHIFQQPDIKQVDEASLERLVTSFPYFTAARLLLARKQYTVQKNLLAPAVKKAQQYSNNMHYFYRFVTTDEKSLVEEQAPVVPAPEEVTNSFADETAAGPQETAPVVTAPYEAPAPVDEPQAFMPATTAPVEPTPVAAQPVAPEATPVESIPVAAQSVAPVATPPEEQPVRPVQQIAEETIPAQTEQVQSVAPAVTEVPAATTTPVQEPKIHVTVPKAPAAPEATAPVNNNEEQITVTANDVAATTAAPAEADAIKIFPLNANTTEAETSLTFQPLYTDDYFAYKRLKEPQQAEQLSEKGAAEMKSFTSWLRDLKDTFAEKAATKQWYQQQLHRSYEDADPEVSEAVEKMAMSSITMNDDIVSETLAEVWARQHQYPAAIHIYQKLSLLNPNKSAYFAQKIRELQLLTEKS
jgi:hypothetical protein